MDEQQSAAVELLSYAEVSKRIRMSRVVIWRRVRDGQFPKPIRMGSTTRVFFVASEVDGWLADRMAERDMERPA